MKRRLLKMAIAVAVAVMIISVAGAMISRHLDAYPTPEDLTPHMEAVCGRLQYHIWGREHALGVDARVPLIMRCVSVLTRRRRANNVKLWIHTPHTYRSRLRIRKFSEEIVLAMNICDGKVYAVTLDSSSQELAEEMRNAIMIALRPKFGGVEIEDLRRAEDLRP